MDIHESLRLLQNNARRGGSDGRRTGSDQSRGGSDTLRLGSGDRSRQGSTDTSPSRSGSSSASEPRSRHGSSSTSLLARSLENLAQIVSRSGSRERLVSNSENPPPVSPLLSPQVRSSVGFFSTPPGSPTFPRSAGSSTIPHQGLSSKSNEWNEVQSALVTLFQGKKLADNQLAYLLTTLRVMAKSEVGGFIYDFYRNQLMKKGMHIMRKSIKSEQGEDLLSELGAVWNQFFREILPTLELVLCPIETKELTIRELTLIGFRDSVVLKKELEGILIELNKKSSVPPAIRQMLLVLQGIHDEDPPSENYLRLERLVGCVIIPHVGFKGVYEGEPEPKIKAQPQAYRKRSSVGKPTIAPNLSRAQSVDYIGKSPLAQTAGPRRKSHIRQASTPAGIILEPLLERAEGPYERRHSIAIACMDDEATY